MRKVLHIIPSISKSHGGPSKAIRTFEKVVNDHNWQFHLATTNEGIIEKAALKEKHPSSRYFFFNLNIKTYKISIGFFFWTLKNIKNYDVVHIHSLFSFTSVVSAFICKYNNIPYIIRPLGVLNEYGMKERRPIIKKISFLLFEKNILNNASVIHFTSTAEKEEAEKLRVEFKSIIIPLAIDLFHQFYFEKISRKKNNPLKILFLSRLDEKKNIESIFYGLKTLKETGVQVYLKLAGSGSKKYITELKMLEKKLDISELIEWIGYVEGNTKVEAFQKADVFILPSFSENFGIAVLEALSFGLPCIVSEGVAISTQIEQHEAGIVIKPNQKSIADAINFFILHEYDLPKYSLNARRLAENEYSMAKMGDSLMLLYKNLVNEKN